MSTVHVLPSAAMELLRALFLHGPTADGDLVSKPARTRMVEMGYVVRENGWNTLTQSGLALSLSFGYDREKEKWARSRRELSYRQHRAYSALGTALCMLLTDGEASDSVRAMGTETLDKIFRHEKASGA